MFQKLFLDRPLAVLDLETTGTDTKTDRIVEISILKLFPDEEGGTRPEPVHVTRRFNPGVPIPAEATAVHGIRDEDVAGEPSFKTHVKGMIRFLDGCDLCGYNLRRFDLKLLAAEAERAGVPFPLAGRRVVDPMQIFHEREKRDLSAALKFYCGRDHDGAHGAAADVLATVAILDAMVSRYADLPFTVDKLHAHQSGPDAMDLDGCFRLVNGHAAFAFGKYKDSPLHVIATSKPDYLEWMLKEGFLSDAKAIVRAALRQD